MTHGSLLPVFVIADPAGGGGGDGVVVGYVVFGPFVDSQCWWCDILVVVMVWYIGGSGGGGGIVVGCLLYTSPSPRDKRQSRMPSSA